MSLSIKDTGYSNRLGPMVSRNQVIAPKVLIDQVPQSEESRSQHLKFSPRIEL